MYSFLQLLRQRIKTISGIILTALALAMVIIFLGQYFASQESIKLLNETFQSAALPTTNYNDAADEWALAYAQEHPDVVTDISDPGLASAYISELTPDNMTSYLCTSQGWDYILEPYDCAVLEIVLTDLKEPTNSSVGVSVELTGIICSIVSLQPDYQDCTGFTGRFTLKLANQQALDDLDLTVGERYLVYMTDYRDSDYLLRCDLCRTLDLDLKEWNDFQKIELFSEEELANHNSSGSGMKKVGRIRIGNNITYIYDYQLPMYMTISGTLEGSEGEYEWPAITHLTEPLEDYLGSEAGRVWQEAIQNVSVNNQAFPVIGVDSLGYLADFLRGSAKVIAGRDFSDQELKSGAKLCIISDTLAEKNGITVGDSLSMQFYDNDENLPYQISASSEKGRTNPTAKYYFAKTTPLYSAETYTVIGIYDSSRDWEGVSENLYAFTPNAIFVPKGSIVSELDFGNGGFFRSLILENGTMDKFAADAVEQGFSKMFSYYDDGYSDVAAHLQEYQKTHMQFAMLGCVAYAVLLLIFIVLFPVQQGKTIRTMIALGATRSRQILHIFLSSFGITVSGMIVGIAAGVSMWQRIADILTAKAPLNISLEMDAGVLILICVIHLALSISATLIAAALVTKNQNPMKRR